MNNLVDQKLEEVRSILERFERLPLSMETVEMFSQAVDELLDEPSSRDGEWIKASYATFLTAYCRSLLEKLRSMNRRDEALSIAVLRLIHRKVYPLVVLAASSKPALAEGYEALLFAWSDYANIAWPIRGPGCTQYVALFRPQ